MVTVYSFVMVYIAPALASIKLLQYRSDAHDSPLSDDEWESLSAFDRSEPLCNILEEDLTENDDALGPMRSPDVVETHVVDGHEVALSLWRVPWSHP